MEKLENSLRSDKFEAIVEDFTVAEEVSNETENVCISRLFVGPLRAQLYITPEEEIQLTTAFIDEEKEKIYQGLSDIISTIPEKLRKIKEEHPARFLHERAWQDYLKDLWKIALDKDYFQNTGW